jgi:hypothetical protein
MNVYAIAVIVAILVGVLGMFFGYVHSLGKSFETNQSQSPIDSSQSKKQQKQQADDVESQRRALMDDIKQKMRDSQHR